MTPSLSNPITGNPSKSAPSVGAVARLRRWMFSLGVIVIAMGVIGLVVLFGLTIIDAWYVGVLLLAAAVAQAVLVPACKGWRGIYAHGAIALIYAVGGAALLADPLIASDRTVVVVAGVVLGAGIARIVLARQVRGPGRIIIMLSGLAALLLGIIVAAGWPLSNPFDVAFVLSLEMLLQGASCLAIILAAPKRAGAVAA